MSNLSDANTIHLIIATGNSGKVRDFRSVFENFDHCIEVESMQAYGGMPEVEETEPDFAGNARLKAFAAKKVIAEGANTWVVADDSGLSVKALDGAPGVHSARFAGEQATDADNREKLLRLLEAVPEGERQAHFTCHLCLLSPYGEQFDFEGICRGSIAFYSSGSHGFGYDPLFIPEGSKQTWGELEDGEKNTESHRARATHQLLDWFKKQYP